MIKKTHLAVGLAVGLTFLNYVNNEIVFLAVVIIASVLPDIDHGFSTVGRKIIFRPIQAMTNHRGILHTYTFCILITLILAMFWPVLALPFFVGYSFHLFLDSFTVQGIKPFWPFKMISKGVIRSGGRVDNLIFMVFAVIDFVLLGITAYRVF